jgi:hypothetical protein
MDSRDRTYEDRGRPHKGRKACAAAVKMMSYNQLYKIILIYKTNMASQLKYTSEIIIEKIKTRSDSLRDSLSFVLFRL